jgi:hypothetical protein
MPTVTADFYADWIDILRQKLTAAGFAPPPGENPQRICFRYFNLRNRGVRAKPRKVERAQGFVPPAHLQKGVDLVQQKFEKGDDLRPHLSTKITDPNFDDDLLSDWGILHLHAGINPHPSKPSFVERTEPVLAVKVEDARALFLDMVQHGQWNKQRMIEILHHNWPDSLMLCRCENVIDIRYTPSDDDIRKLRKGHISSFVKTQDGTVYAPPGGGITLAGGSTRVVIECGKYAQQFRRQQRDLERRAQELIDRAAKRGIQPTDNLSRNAK